MKRRLLACLLLGALAGCASGLTFPSFDACSHVRYERTGPEIHVEADCRIP